MPLVVHGCVAADAATRPFPSREVEVEVVTHRDVAALVTATDEDEILPTRGALVAHTEVLEQAAARATVVPMRFGMVAPDADTLVASYLGPEHDRLIDRLGRLDGRVELRVRGRYGEEAVISWVIASDRRAARLRGATSFSARMELGERIAAGIEQQRDRDTRTVTDAIAPHATDLVGGPVSDPLDAFTISVLVDRRRTDAIDQAVTAVAEVLPHVDEIEIVGPLPPFSFATDGEAAR